MSFKHTAHPAAPEKGDWVDALLHASAEAPLADDGFTDRVLAALPDQPAAAHWQEALAQRRQRDARFLAWSLGGIAIGSLLALFTGQWPDTQQLVDALVALVADHHAPVQPVMSVWLAGLLSAGLLAYVLMDSVERP